MENINRIIIIFCCYLFSISSISQTYFPPNNSNIWDTISPASLSWCQNKIDSLYDFLEINNTKSFILLKDGKIVLEKNILMVIQIHLVGIGHQLLRQ